MPPATGWRTTDTILERCRRTSDTGIFNTRSATRNWPPIGSTISGAEEALMTDRDLAARARLRLAMGRRLDRVTAGEAGCPRCSFGGEGRGTPPLSPPASRP